VGGADSPVLCGIGERGEEALVVHQQYQMEPDMAITDIYMLQNLPNKEDPPRHCCAFMTLGLPVWVAELEYQLLEKRPIHTWGGKGERLMGSPTLMRDSTVICLDVRKRCHLQGYGCRFSSCRWSRRSCSRRPGTLTERHTCPKLTAMWWGEGGVGGHGWMSILT
jgi:hypothetical protein